MATIWRNWSKLASKSHVTFMLMLVILTFHSFFSRFVPDKEFSGTDRAGPSGPRSGPVQFEKEEDPFGLDKFLTDVRKASSKRPADGDRSDKDKDKDKDKRKRRD